MLLRSDYVTVNTVSDDERPSHEAITQVGGCVGGLGGGEEGGEGGEGGGAESRGSRWVVGFLGGGEKGVGGRGQGQGRARIGGVTH